MRFRKFVRVNTSILLAILAFAFAAVGQSKDGANPTAFTSSEFTGKGPSKETNYYFSFSGGPGEVTVRLEIKAKSYSTFARLEILDAEQNALAMHNMNASTSSGAQQVVKKIDLDEKQTVVLKVTLDGNLASYKITLGGAVETGTPSTDSTASTGTPETTGSTDTTASTETVQEQPADPSPTTTGGKNKFFNVDLGKYKLGQFINFPKTGTLVIQLKDGTAQEIDLASVKSVTVKK